MINSYALKNCLFQFVNSYITLFYYAFFLQNFDLVTTTVASVVTTNCILSLITVNHVLVIIFYSIYKESSHTNNNIPDLK